MDINPEPLRVVMDREAHAMQSVARWSHGRSREERRALWVQVGNDPATFDQENPPESPEGVSRLPALLALDDLDEGRTYRVLCTPKDGDPFDILDKYQDRDGDTLIFRSHRINLDVMQDVQISAYRRGGE